MLWIEDFKNYFMQSQNEYCKDFYGYLERLIEQQNDIRIYKEDNKIIVDDDINLDFEGHRIFLKNIKIKNVVFKQNLILSNMSSIDDKDFSIEIEKSSLGQLQISYCNNIKFLQITDEDSTINQILITSSTLKEINLHHKSSIDYMYINNSHFNNLNIIHSNLNNLQLNNNNYFNNILVQDSKIDNIFFIEDIVNPYHINRDYVYKINIINCNINKCNFSNFHFVGYVSFEESNFMDNAYFDNATFSGIANFKRVKFNKSVSFYNATFNKLPIFLNTIFLDEMNMVNTKIDFVFDELKNYINNYIDEEYKDLNANSSKKEDKDKVVKAKLELANDFRDSFRLIKHTLNKNGNTLDATQYHKLELYCKELELSASKSKRGIKANNNIDTQKNAAIIRDIVEYALLYFYRKLCDHHTDTLKAINSLVLLISLYGVFVFIAFPEVFDNSTMLVKRYKFNIPESYKPYIYITFIIILVAIVTLLVMIIKALVSFIKLMRDKERMNNLWNCIKEDYSVIKKDIIRLLIVICLLFAFASIIQYYTPKSINSINLLLNLIVSLLFAGLYISIVCIDNVILKMSLCFVAYVICGIMLGCNIVLINPLIGKLVGESISLNNAIFNTLSVIYTILMFLVIFSLQKTTRKNSIIPS